MNYFTIIFMMLLSGTVFAQKVAFIDLDRSLPLLYDYPDINVRVTKFVNQKNKQLDYEFDQLNLIKNKYLQSNDQKLLKEFKEKDAIYQIKSKNFQQEINTYAENQRVPLLRKLIKFSQQYAVTNNIEVLLDSNKYILYEKQEVRDISNEVLRVYNLNKNK
jgi:Skp family chaperone for outer membrane proteins